MQITSHSSRRGEAAGVVKTDNRPAAAPRAAAAPAQAASAAASLQSMPEIDQAKVAEVRAALARGEVRFNPERLAGLIEQYHGGR
ncbi:flagellar biosynthesis anti-sigma factor FlgM [Chromobacterium alticapitis]|uniref:Negative regulator of flagellin synthesis n=1 Tax=Chromobacterium alticapitis TaxID=2073169 RepID=A0A2S5DK34_9NEIS|nr:flagellar biosynthesis anti-sigma factor FlgM [Chromobacterium alticapitis]POZ63389.1 flagellar biosynthesis anti-sigma factor FlgM [Chromobacterium alticapitis]